MKSLITIIVGLVAGLVISQTLLVKSDTDLADELSALKIEHAELQKRYKALDNLKSSSSGTKAVSDVDASSTSVSTGTPVERGSMKISGIVVDSKNRPLSGVTVTTQPSIGWEATTDDSEDDYVNKMRDYYRKVRARKFNSTTDGQGRFSFDSLPEGTYSLTASLEGWIFHMHNTHSINRSRDNIRIRGSKLSGVKVSISGLPEGADPVTVTYASQRYSSAQTLAAGLAEGLVNIEQPGRYTLTAKSGHLVSESAAVVVKEGEFSELSLTLESRPGIAGTVDLSALGGGQVWLSVKAIPVADGEDVADDRVFNHHDGTQHVGQHSDEFSFVPLKAGRYTVVLMNENAGEILQKKDVVVSDGVAEIELAVPKPDLSKMIVLNLKGTFEAPPEVSQVYAAVRTGNRNSSSGVVFKYGDGNMLQVTPSKPINDFIDEGKGSVELTVMTASHGNLTLDLQRGVREYDLEFKDPGHLTVTVSSIPEATTISAHLESVDDAWSHHNQPVVLDGKGQAELGPLAPGPYRLKIIKGTEAWNGTVLLEQEISLKSGHQDVALEMPRMYTLTVTGMQEAVGRIMFNREGDGFNGGGRNKTPVDGKLVLEDVTPGVYTLSVFSTSMQTMKIRVDGDMTVAWAGKEVNAFEFSVAEGSKLAELGFEDGDKLVGIGNKRFKNFMEIMVTMEVKFEAAAKAGKKIKLLLLRDGREVQLEVPADAIERAGDKSVSPAHVD